MNCPKHEEASAYVDGMLPSSEREQFAAHMRTCPICLARVDDLRALRRDLRELPSAALGVDLAARLGPRLQRPVSRRPLRSFWIAWGGPGLAAALSLTVGAWLGGMLAGGSISLAPQAGMIRVFDPVPPGGLCAVAELCGPPKGLK